MAVRFHPAEGPEPTRPTDLSRPEYEVHDTDERRVVRGNRARALCWVIRQRGGSLTRAQLDAIEEALR